MIAAAGAVTPIFPVRSAHMRKITLPSGTMLATEASNQVPIRNALTTNRVYASIIYRFSGRWLP